MVPTVMQNALLPPNTSSGNEFSLSAAKRRNPFTPFKIPPQNKVTNLNQDLTPNPEAGKPAQCSADILVCGFWGLSSPQ